MPLLVLAVFLLVIFMRSGGSSSIVITIIILPAHKQHRILNGSLLQKLAQIFVGIHSRCVGIYHTLAMQRGVLPFAQGCHAHFSDLVVVSRGFRYDRCPRYLHRGCVQLKLRE